MKNVKFLDWEGQATLCPEKSMKIDQLDYLGQIKDTKSFQREEGGKVPVFIKGWNFRKQYFQSSEEKGFPT